MDGLSTTLTRQEGDSCVKLLKNHWPIIITVVVWIGSVFDFRLIGASNSDALGLGLLFFYILMPLCAFVTALWYGHKLSQKTKWLIVVVLGLLEVLVITTSTGDWDFGYYWSMAFWTAIPAAIGMVIGSMVRKNKEV